MRSAARRGIALAVLCLSLHAMEREALATEPVAAAGIDPRPLAGAPAAPAVGPAAEAGEHAEAGTAAARVRRPNVVVVLTDDLSLGLMAYLPELHAMLAGKGLELRATSPSAVCAPARASFFTGRYAHNHGVVNNTVGADGFHATGGERSTFATWTHAIGYSTGYFGKYMNGHLGGDAYVPAGWGRFLSLRTLREDRYAFTTVEDHDRDRSLSGVYDVDFTAAEATAFVASAREPFLAVWAPSSPHAYYESAQRHRGRFDGLKIAWPPSFDADPEALTKLVRRRLEMMLAVQEGVASLLAALTRRGAMERTYVIFTSDNGLLLGEHGLVDYKQCPNEEAVQVPLYVRGPGVAPGRNHALVAIQDLAPTIAELTGAAIPAEVDGRSIVPLLGGVEPPGWRRRVLLEFLGFRDWFRGLRTKTYKFARYSNRPYVVYRLDTDPYELAPRGCQTRRAQNAADLVAKLVKCSGATCRELEDQCEPGNRRCWNEVSAAGGSLDGHRPGLR